MADPAAVSGEVSRRSDRIVAPVAPEDLVAHRPEIVGASVHIEGLCKTYGPVKAVDDFNLQIRAGEFLSILGASGSGKSTVLRMIAGLEEPTSGRIIIGQRDATSLPPEGRDIGMVFQDYALFPHMSVLHNIAFPLRMRSRPREEIARRVDDVMKLVGISALGDREPSQISGGQQQRVALARALVFDPKLLLLDEPLSALDKSLRDQMKAEIKLLHRRVGVTVVFVTHDQSEALALSDRVVVMRHGRIVDVDEPERLYRAPANRYIASFIGEANLIDGMIGSVAGDTLTVNSTLGKIVLRASQVRAAGPLLHHRPLTVVFRPEDIVIEPKARSSGDVIAVDCRIEECLYNGSYTTLDLRPVAGGSSLIARVQLADPHALQVGSRICIGLRAARAVAVDQEQ